MTLPAAYAHCEAELRGQDHDAWLAALFAPAEVRPHLHALGAFGLEIRQVRLRVRQAIAGELRLQWWQEVVDGERAGEAAAHPVAAALRDTMQRAALPAAPFGDILDAYRVALYDEPPADLPALERGLIAMRSIPIRLAARVLGEGAGTDPAADDAGVALGVAALLDVLRGDSGERPAPLPSDLLARHGVSQADVDAGRDTAGLRAVLTDLRALARSRLASLRARRATLGEAGPAFLVTALIEPRLKAGEKASDPFMPSHGPAPWRRPWRLWRAARRGGAL